jgi:hypothetical protein
LKTGIFGGTFDPPHIAHLILAGEALHQLGLDRLLWVLTPFPPHKQGRISCLCILAWSCSLLPSARSRLLSYPGLTLTAIPLITPSIP